MFTKIEDVVDPGQLAIWSREFDDLTWEDGMRTAGAAQTRKNNEQLTPATEAARPLLKQALQIVMGNQRIKMWAEPRRIARIMFARYGEGMYYGSHNDAPITHFHPQPTRADISFTIFLNDPGDYDGGELVLETPVGEITAKEAPGTIVLYDTGLRHRVEKITRGTRIVVVGWIESLIRSPDARDVLRDLSAVLQQVATREPEGEEAISLRRVRGNLVRMWAET